MLIHPDTFNTILHHSFNLDTIHAYVNLRLVSHSWKNSIDNIISDKIQEYYPGATNNQNYIKWFVLMYFVKKNLFPDVTFKPQMLISNDMGLALNDFARTYLSQTPDACPFILYKCYRSLMQPLIHCTKCENQKCIKYHSTYPLSYYLENEIDSKYIFCWRHYFLKMIKFDQKK